ncbi:MAG: DEAD-box ATP-dependent RNA helicase CshA [Alphaproteobacteria bacterium ADurb.BinA305]|nr:MAG: DEAD-box ATP-dependent RNA helicase CshA [Alphaproteobacteria bacterium ADurb.BinA305]
MMVSDAALAPTSPPETGASSQSAPVASTCLANACVSIGEIELMSTTVLPLASAPATPWSPNSTFCTGRMIDLIERKAMSVGDLEAVVIDEADRMADMGFLPQVEWILRHIPGDHQTLLFSATLDGVVQGLIDRYQTDPVRHEVESAGVTVAMRCPAAARCPAIGAPMMPRPMNPSFIGVSP